MLDEAPAGSNVLDAKKSADLPMIWESTVVAIEERKIVLRRILIGSVIAAWVALTIAPLLFASGMLRSVAEPAGNTAAVVTAADIRPALLGVASSADVSLRSGDMEPLNRAITDLDDRRAELEIAAAGVIGEQAAIEALGALSLAIDELNAAARRYASGGGAAGDGGAGYMAALDVADGIIHDLSGALDGDTARLGEIVQRSIYFVLAAALIALSGVGMGAWYLLTVGRRVMHGATHLDVLSQDLPSMIYETDGEHRITFVSEASRTLLGTEPKHLIGRPLTDFVRELPIEFGPPQRDGSRLLHGDADWRCEDGTRRRLSMIARAIYGDDGELVATRGTISDRSDEIAAGEALRESEERLRIALDTAQHGMMIIAPEGQLEFHNQALSGLLGYPADELTQLTIEQFVHQRDLDMVMGMIASRMWSDAEPSRFEVQLVRRDGEFIDVELSIASFRENGARVGVLAEVTDLTESKRASATIRRMADYDSLTALPNRALFDRSVEQAVLTAREQQAELGILMIDLDRFKFVNDTLGHASGDRLLKTIARRLQDYLPSQRTLARFAGDEFLVLIEGQRSDELPALTLELLNMLREPISHDGHELIISASIGMSIFPQHGGDAETLVQRAGTALTLAKALGGNAFEIYDPQGAQPAPDRLAIEVEARHAIERDELQVYYQPQIDFATGRIVAFEALVRWQHPQRGLISPNEFVPVLEESGLIVEMDQWVLRNACQQMHEWHQAGLTDARLAVNVSAREFLDASLAERIRTTLEETGFCQSCLDIEVTETTATLNMDASVRSLTALRELGVGTALDDFGIGHSSLARLKQFPVDTLKIDRSFIATMQESAHDLAIVAGVVALGHALDLTVVAEGIETEEQSRLLAELGCDVAQGYFYSRPIDAASTEAMLRNGGLQALIAA